MLAPVGWPGRPRPQPPNHPTRPPPTPHALAQVRSWAVAPELYPRDPSPESLALAKRAVKLAVGAWGERQLSALEAEDRLSVACEKGLSEDEVTLALRAAYQVGKRQAGRRAACGAKGRLAGGVAARRGAGSGGKNSDRHAALHPRVQRVLAAPAPWPAN